MLAHSTQIKKHSSYDCAPDKPFRKTKANKEKSSSDGGCMSSGGGFTVSPSKHVNLRGQRASQLL